MVKDRENTPSRRRRSSTPEEMWIRSFLEFSGTENITRFCRADFHGVSLTRAIEAIFLGELTRSEKCEGPGTLCTFQHDADDGVVEVEVFFVAGEMVFEIRGAMLTEVQGEPDAA